MLRLALTTFALLALLAGEASAQEAREQTPRACQDGVDNDGDGYLDCSDFDCRPLRFCIPARPEDSLSACHDSIDNDQDGDLDCADSECRDLSFCALGRRPPPEPLPDPGDREDTLAECQNGRDDDGDGRADCRDPDCCDFAVCPDPRPGRTAAAERTLALCRDRSDTAADGTVDCDDPDCQVFVRCAPDGGGVGPALPPDLPRENTAALCGDGLDNDEDGDLDCADDDCGAVEACVSDLPPPPIPTAPTAEDSPELCSDEFDNDGDGAADCGDVDCSDMLSCAGEPSPGVAYLRVTTAVPGATVRIDGRVVGTTPFEGSGPPGEHLVRVEAEGYDAVEQPVVLEVGVTRDLDLSLVELAPPSEGVGWFALGIGLQAPFMMLGEAASSAVGGASLQVRPLLAVVRSPVILDIGLQLTTGYMGSAEFPAIERAGVEYESNDSPAFFDAKYFTAGLFIGLTIPVLSREGRPVVALTLHTSQGLSVAPAQYVMDLAFGLSYFASRRAEIRFELLGVQLWRGEAYTWEPDDLDGTYQLRDLWFAHLAPSLGVHIRL